MEDFLRRQGELSAKLARANINIISYNATDRLVFYEYQFRMANNQTKWAKTVYILAQQQDLEGALEDIVDIVRAIRIEAENGRK